MALRPTFNPLRVGMKPDEMAEPINDFMQSALGVLRRVPNRQLVVMKFKTPATATDVFPLNVTLAAGMVPRSVVIGRVINWRTPETPLAAAFFVDWMPAAGGITIRNVVGVSSNATYEITLEVTGE